jgi:hypothetical protein
MSDREVSLHTSPDGDQTGRRYVDIDGVRWCVREVHPKTRQTALYFESDVSFRRVAHYPLDWETLSTGELAVLSRGT